MLFQAHRILKKVLRLKPARAPEAAAHLPPSLNDPFNSNQPVPVSVPPNYILLGYRFALAERGHRLTDRLSFRTTALPKTAVPQNRLPSVVPKSSRSSPLTLERADPRYRCHCIIALFCYVVALRNFVVLH